jgi:hypothetical protein
MTRTMLMVVTLLVGCATGAVMREVVAPARAQGQVGPNYEYEMVEVYDDTKEKGVLSRYGHEGWRLVSVTRRSGDRTGNPDARELYFERQAAH